ncbi:MAG: hypothetical protein ABFC96_06675 [Thermoguttaceae bacterium]
MPHADEPRRHDLVLSADAPLQFGIRDLLIAQFACALGLGLLAIAGVFGIMAIFAATIIFCFVYKPTQPPRIKLKRFLVDLMGGIVLPAVCLVYYPRVGCRDLFLAVAAGNLVPVAVQMLTLFVWLLFGPQFGRWSALFAGVLSLGAFASGGLGALFFFPSLLCLGLYGIGVLGFVPLLTCYTFLGNADEAMRRAQTAH